MTKAPCKPSVPLGGAAAKPQQKAEFCPKSLKYFIWLQEKKGFILVHRLPAQKPNLPSQGRKPRCIDSAESQNRKQTLHKQEEKIQDRKVRQGEGSGTFPALLAEALVISPRNGSNKMPQILSKHTPKSEFPMSLLGEKQFAKAVP